MIAIDKQDRSRQNSVWVDDIEYPIHTEFYYWISYSKKFEKLQREGAKEFSLLELDYLYTWKPPEDRAKGYEELNKFYLNEQSLPHDMGKQSSAKSIDWLHDSERIYAAFLSRYSIDLLTVDLHWHSFLSLFNALFWDLERVVGARLWVKKPSKLDVINEEHRNMWRLDVLEEKKPVFKMR